MNLGVCPNAACFPLTASQVWPASHVCEPCAIDPLCCSIFKASLTWGPPDTLSYEHHWKSIFPVTVDKDFTNIPTLTVQTMLQGCWFHPRPRPCLRHRVPRGLIGWANPESVASFSRVSTTC